MKNNKKIKVRFAPSPTGNLHIGGMRTALFNWLFARHHGGAFLVRVEDTDLQRSKKEYVEAQIAALEWCGIESDQKLVYQSERTDAYQLQLEALFEQGKVYRCVCTPEEIEARKQKYGERDEYSGYDGYCRNMQEHLFSNGDKPFVIRFAVPEDTQKITFEDAIRGTVTFESKQFDDFIIVRSDGSPTYNFAVVVDDAFMGITNVIRGDDHLTNTPKQILLYQACGFQPPQFAHIPLILNSEGHRLSKRDGAVDVLEYRKAGYLADALVNYSVRLGWAHGDDEVFTIKQLIEYFTLEAVGKKSAVFDIQKLQWLNSVYLKRMTPQSCLVWLVTDVQNDLYEQLKTWKNKEIHKAIELYQERVKTGAELCHALIDLHAGPSLYEVDDIKKWMTREARGYLDMIVPKLEALDEFSTEKIDELIKAFCKEHGIKLVTIAQSLRIALTGGASSPGVFELLALVGKKESIRRIHALQRHLEAH